MELRLAYIAGIAKQETEALEALGIAHTNQLLHLTSVGIDRQRVCARTGISPDRLCEFARQCSLMEVTGILPYLRYLPQVGINGPKDLRRADPLALQKGLERAVGPHRAPTTQMVEYWISQERSIDVLEEDGEMAPASLSSPSVFGQPPQSDI